MSPVLFCTIIALGVINLISLAIMLVSPIDTTEEGFIDTLIYRRIFNRLKNTNTLGKTLLCIIVTPFTIVAQLIIFAFFILVAIGYYAVFGLAYIFAIDKTEVKYKFLSREFIDWLDERNKRREAKKNTQNKKENKK